MGMTYDVVDRGTVVFEPKVKQLNFLQRVFGWFYKIIMNRAFVWYEEVPYTKVRRGDGEIIYTYMDYITKSLDGLKVMLENNYKGGKNA